MASSGEYNSLGQVLAMGAEQSVAVMLARGASSGDISSLLKRKFGPIEPETESEVMSLATRMRESGRRITLGEIEGELRAEEIVLVPQLFGDEPAGRRARVIGEVELEEGEPLIRVYVDFADLPSADQIYAEILSRAFEIITMYPEKFDIDPDQVASLHLVNIISIGRRF